MARQRSREMFQESPLSCLLPAHAPGQRSPHALSPPLPRKQARGGLGLVGRNSEAYSAALSSRRITPSANPRYEGRQGRGCNTLRRTPMSPATGRTKAEDYIGAPSRPFTGREYLESLRDGREIYIYGERVPDVTTHPAFRNAARTIARLYDALHDPATKDLLTCPTDTGNGGYTHKF